MDSNVSFKGILYGKTRNHLTKGIICCPHGDNKFVRFVNSIGENSTNIKEKIKVTCSSDGLDKILIETKEIPKLSFWEQIFFRVDKLQNKAIKWRKEGKIDSFVFKLNELEYVNLRDNYPYLPKKQLRKFANVVKSAAPDEMQKFLNNFFGKL